MNPVQPGKLFWLVALAVFWALYGLGGRDAWQTEEALALGSVLHVLQHGDGFWAGIAAAPAPLFTLLAATFAKLFPALLPALYDIQDAARLASGVFSLLALLGIGFAARSLLGTGFGPVAALALAGGFGLMLRAHALIPETALLAVWAWLLCGMGLARTRPQAGGAILGISLALLFLGLRGLVDLLAAGLILLLPLAFRSWRERTYRRALTQAVLLACALILAGMALLAFSGKFDVWQASHATLPALADIGSLRMFKELAWMAWPLWPLALAALWHDHRRLARAPALFVPVIAMLVLFVAAQFPAWSRFGALLPLLLPLSLLAAQAVEHMRRGAAQAFYWFGVLCFLFFIIVFWTYFAAIEWGAPVKLAAHLARLTPGYSPGSVALASIALAAGVTLLWLIAIPLFPRAQARPILVWSTGMTVVWVLLAALFRPWAEASWGYRPMLTDMAQHLPAGACLDLRVDAGMKVMARYHLHPRTQPDCRWRMTQTASRKGVSKTTDAHIVWEGYRQRYKNQVYRLEYRDER